MHSGFSSVGDTYRVLPQLPSVFGSPVVTACTSIFLHHGLVGREEGDCDTRAGINARVSNNIGNRNTCGNGMEIKAVDSVIHSNIH